MRVILGCLLVLLAACGANPDPNDDESLVLVLDRYTQLVRWQQWPGAAGLVAPERRSAWLQDRLRGARGLHITEVIVAGVRQDPPDAPDAEVYLQIGWYRMPDTTVRQSLWKQRWILTPSEGWRLEGEEVAKEAPAAKPQEPPPAWP